MQSVAVAVPNRLPEGGVPAAENRWAGFLELVAAEYPFCTMYGVHIVEGCVVSCEGTQRSFVFGAADEAIPAAAASSDAHWKALKALCVKMGSGRLAELRFSGGRPVSARTSESGRRFKRLLDRGAKDANSNLPMN